ncbi:NAD(P)-binding domain-containing protein [Xylophilus sp. GW821-FHT01B05]
MPPLTSAIVREAVFGPEGLAASLSAGKVLVDQTTGDPAETRALDAEPERLGVALVDAPVSGSPSGAKPGTIVTLCGGAAEAFARLGPSWSRPARLSSTSTRAATAPSPS